MDAERQGMSQDLSQSTTNNGVSGIQPVVCSLCQKILSPDNEANGDLETINICGDCRFLLLEDYGTPVHESPHRRPPSRRRTRYSSSESIENLFSQQFSHMINLARQNQSTVSGLEDSLVDGDATSRLPQRRSFRATPRRARRWRQVPSDTESDGFDNTDSLYAESESNVSFGRHRVFHVESDAISFSTYGGDSDASVDLHGFLDPEMFTQPNEGSDFDSDTDIDPMHAGLNQWHSDDLEGGGGGGGEDDDEEEEEEGDGEWDEVEGENYTVESRGAEAGSRLQSFLLQRPTERNYPVTWPQETLSPEAEGMIRWRASESSQTYAYDIFANLEDSEFLPYVGNSGDYLDARGFEDLLQHLAEADNSRRGAPPASVSFVNSLPRVVINNEQAKHDDLACAICKDLLTIGTVVNQLPCNHLYHPSCILPWLSARNSCPLCRYELPTDDKDYEEGKQNIISGVQINDVQQNVSDDSSSDVSVTAEEDEEHEFSGDSSEQRELLDVGSAINGSVREGGRGRWFFLAAAPIVSLVGIVLVLWLGNPLTERRGPARPEQRQQQIHISGSSFNQRENRSRRWWSLF